MLKQLWIENLENLYTFFFKLVTERHLELFFTYLTEINFTFA